MRIKLRESQYSRLLKENDKDFLDGTVNFKEIGNKVDRFIIKCFNFIRKQYPNFKQLRDIPRFSKKISQDLAIPNAVCLVICYNYFLKISTEKYEGDFSEFLGQPLEFYGEFGLSEEIPMIGHLNGYQMGTYTGYATNQEEFLDQLEDGEYYNYDTTDNYVEYDGVNIDWEVDDGYIDDYISDRVIGYRDDMEDNVDLVNN